MGIHKTQSLNSILIIKLSAIGDVVHSLPFLEVIKERFPNARIDWLVEEEALQIIKGHPALDRIIISRRKSWQQRVIKEKEWLPVFREVLAFVKYLRSRKYDMVIDLQGLLKSGILIGISRGKRKIGMTGVREGARLFVNEQPVLVDYEEHAIDRYLKIAEYLGCNYIPWKGTIPIYKSDERAIERILKSIGTSDKILVAINPMARWKTKLWDPRRFAALAERLQKELSCLVIFTGSKNDRAFIRDIVQMMNAKPINLAGLTSLKELALLYKKCRAIVTTDSGPMHIAAAMGCRVISLFGPTAPWRTGPYGPGHEIIRMDLSCSPCFKKKCNHLTCMKGITVENVFMAVRNIVQANEAAKI